jgi:hypothetical protein
MNTENSFPLSTPHQLQTHHALQNAAVSLDFEHWDILPSVGVDLTVGIICQAQPAAANGPLDGRWEDIHHSVGGVADPERLQDPHHVNLLNHGMVVVTHYPPSFNVTNSPSVCGPLIDDKEPTVLYGFPDEVGRQGFAAQAQGQPIVPVSETSFQHRHLSEHFASGESRLSSSPRFSACRTRASPCSSSSIWSLGPCSRPVRGRKYPTIRWSLSTSPKFAR